jgi:geranylgeranyl pyrophosphate synthase
LKKSRAKRDCQVTQFFMALLDGDHSLDLLAGAAAKKSVTNDLKQAKATPVLLHALAKADSRDRRTIESALGTSRMTVSMAARVMAIYRKHDAIACAQRLSREHVARSRNGLAKLPAGEARERFGAILDVLDHWSPSREELSRAAVQRS